MWRYVLDLMVKSDSRAEIIKQLEKILQQLKEVQWKGEDLDNDVVEYEYELRG